MKEFLVKLFLFTLAVAAADFCWIRFAPVEKHIPHVWLIVAFFAAVTALFHYLSIRVSNGKPQVFIRYYMGTTALRLFLYSIIIVAYRFHDKSGLTPFAIGFMGHYFLYTFFEVPMLLRELRKN